MNMEPISLSIRQLRLRNLLSNAVCYGDDIVITNHVELLEPLRHPFRIQATMVLVCLQGEIECSINLKQYLIRANTMLVNFTGNIIQVHRAEGLEAYAILLSAEYLNDLQIDFRQRVSFYMDIRQNAVTSIPYEEMAPLRHYYPLMKYHMELQRTEHEAILRGLVQAFSYTVISLMQVIRADKEKAARDESAPRSQQLFDKFMALLKLHHASERSTKFYAERLCLTPNYLSGVVKEYSGRTVSEWINEYVILEAKILLKNTDLSIQEIAYRLNFATQSAFGKYFKLQTGMGPKCYRYGNQVRS